MKAALTGATGFIGRYIAREFMTPEDTLRAMVRPTSNSQFLKEGGAELVVGDFGDDDSLRKLVDGMDVVIHNGYWHDRNELQEPMKWFELNVLGSLKLLEYSRRAGLKRFLFISSGAVYGRVRNPEEPRDELTGCFPRGGYAAYNRAVEVYVPAYRSEFDMTGSASVRLCGRNVGVHRKIEASAYRSTWRETTSRTAVSISRGTCGFWPNSRSNGSRRSTASVVTCFRCARSPKQSCAAPAANQRSSRTRKLGSLRRVPTNASREPEEPSAD